MSSNHDMLTSHFEKKIEKMHNGCWIWNGAIGTRGNPVYKARSATKVIYESFVGEVPEGRYIKRGCESVLCVNPFHLCITERKEKSLRCRIAISKQNISEIKEMLIKNIPQIVISRKFNISPSMVCLIAKGRRRVSDSE